MRVTVAGMDFLEERLAGWGDLGRMTKFHRQNEEI